MTRLLGTSQISARDLKTFIKTYESFLKKRDHRTWGPKLNLFSFSEQMGLLGVIWHPKGMQLRHLLLDWLNHQLPENDRHVSTPQVVKEEFLGRDLRR